VASRINPFHNLYLGEATGPDRFVHLFSPLFVENVTALFQPGNVVLQGLQGSGKTMLLNLLKPETRVAYFNAKVPFPVREELGRFIGAGINLRKAGLTEFGQLVLPETTGRELRVLALQYGDFLNYWIIADILSTINRLQAANSALLDQIGLRIDDASLDRFAKELSTAPCFFGYLSGAKSYLALRERVAERIVTYRKFINFTLESAGGLPEAIKESVTVAGEPVAIVSAMLKQEGILEADTEVYVRVDQYEQLATLNASSKFGELCQQVTHKLMASRDDRVSYRFGTRQYAWPETPRIFGTTDALEHKRDYTSIEIDDKLRRKENSRTWIFPEFAVDIFKRRFFHTTYAGDAIRRASGVGGGEVEILDRVFGKSLLPVELAERYVKAEARRRVLRFDDGAPKVWQDFLTTLGLKNPLAAKFADAWVHQKDEKKQALVNDPPDTEGPFPWDSKKYWVKERNEQALVQLASANGQQLIWSGARDLVHLSGGNILVFLFLCQNIWDVWLRDTRRDRDISESALPSIAKDVQSQGIREASEDWSRKVKEGEHSEKRSRFLQFLGKHVYRVLTDDRPMSNPGANGFSISISDLDANLDLKQFLELCVEYGDLYDAPHTSKIKGEMRRKYYLAPILSPYYKIPYVHTKEPLYVNAAEVSAWLEEKPVASRVSDDPRQLNFFDGSH
jgi:hypothetical protein